MSDVNVTVFIESPHVKSFLFECGKYWASEGNRVYFVSNTQQESLPPYVQGAGNTSDTYVEFMNMSFVTAPNSDSLKNFLLNLQTATHIPKVLVIEDVTGYVNTTDSSDQNFPLLCALLKHTALTCWRYHKSTIFLILSIKFIPEKLNIVNFILNPGKIWKTVPANDSDTNVVKNFALQEISTNPLNNTSQTLEFSLLEKNDEPCLRLNNIKELFGESCNFNSKVF